MRPGALATWHWTAAPRAPRAWAWLGLLTGVLVVAVAVPPHRAAWLSACLVHLVLGVPGPGCGMTRAFLFLGHGDVHAALEMNPNAALAFGLVLALWINAVLRVGWGHQVALRLSRRARWAVVGAAAALTGAAWVYNLVWNPWV